MANVSQDKLLDVVDSRYSLVSLAARRAKQIREGSPKLITTDSTNPLTIALEEIAAGRLTYTVPDHDEPATALVEEPEMMGLPAAPGTEDILPIPEDMAEEAEQVLPEAAAVEEMSLEAPEELGADTSTEETPLAEVEVPAEEETPESTATEQASQPED